MSSPFCAVRFCGVLCQHFLSAAGRIVQWPELPSSAHSPSRNITIRTFTYCLGSALRTSCPSMLMGAALHSSSMTHERAT
ncbi:hypothetical protein FKP32DRAFT_1594926 [Trametes sanguinea]|nr:hypothetical protein FKP32DRAFT_1594926 [Trametes sanguinea]